LQPGRRCTFARMLAIIWPTLPTQLRIQLLGGFRLALGDKVPQGLEAPSVRSLVTYLLVHRALPLPRQQIAFALWPDTLESQAQTNLRTLFVRLRRAWPELDDYLEVGPRAVQWRAGIPLELDVAEFEAAIERAAEGGVERQAALEAAIRLYRGDLLPDAYDEWLPAERERLYQAYLQALRGLIT